jgi:hypothetical protein
MLVTGVQHDPMRVWLQELGNSAGMLKDSGVAARLEQVDLRPEDGTLPSGTRTHEADPDARWLLAKF